MEDEIKVGEWVRTFNGEIGKIIKIKNDDEYSYDYYVCDNDSATSFKMQIVKHSPNLIDLVEVGDVIQLKGAEKFKYEVLQISWIKSKGKHIHIINSFRMEGGKDIFIEDIESLITHEQFEQIKYKVKE